jgi:hypothetical protein
VFGTEGPCVPRVPAGDHPARRASWLADPIYGRTKLRQRVLHVMCEIVTPVDIPGVQIELGHYCSWK